MRFFDRIQGKMKFELDDVKNKIDQKSSITEVLILKQALIEYFPYVLPVKNIVANIKTMWNVRRSR